MRIPVTLDDDLGDLYQKEAFSRRVGLPTVLAERLHLALPLDPRKRGLVIADQQVLAELEEKLGGGSIKDEHDLIAKVRRLAQIKFGSHEFKLTPGQFEELAFRAEKTGRSVERLMQDLYTRMSVDLFRTVA